jgi:aminoglycoside phosphotransferase (APT) family kinase protein
MRRLPHGYTNRTHGDGTTVVKSYEGPDAPERRERERRLLADLADAIPVPPVIGADGDALTLGFVPGMPGQELLETGSAAEVLRACGTVLRSIHSIPPASLSAPLPERGPVLVHGDFGPNNLLLGFTSNLTCTVTGVVDWEFAHLGEAIEDLAWCEWIVRTHHPDRVEALDAFFAGYGGPVPDWSERQAAMVERCVELREFCRRWDPDGPAVPMWDGRIATTAGW